MIGATMAAQGVEDGTLGVDPENKTDLVEADPCPSKRSMAGRQPASDRSPYSASSTQRPD